MKYYLMTFGSTHLAIETERTLKSHLSVTMIPTPRELTASCGLSLQLPEADFEKAFELLRENGFSGISLYLVTKPEEGPRVYETKEWGQ